MDGVRFTKPVRAVDDIKYLTTDEQQKLMQSTEKGETLVSVLVTDESGEEPIKCEMLWAWVSKSQLKN